MKYSGFALAGLAVTLGLGGCAETPTGPRVQVLPGVNKPFEIFMQDQMLCKQYASEQVSGQAQSANEKGLIEALVGSALGAGLGAATGGGHGAGVGAAVGGVAGTVVGGASSSQSHVGIQQQYDNAYSQCMYAKGNQIIAQPSTIRVVQPPPTYYAPPPTYYQEPAIIYSQPQPAAPAPQGYTAPTGAATPPPGTAAPATAPAQKQ